MSYTVGLESIRRISTRSLSLTGTKKNFSAEFGLNRYIILVGFFSRWLRQKYEQGLEEKRRVRLEAKQRRRRERQSIKRQQLQQDIQLAKSYGYS